MDYTVHRILQARILEWVAFPFSRGSSQTRDHTQVSHIAGGFFTSWASKNPEMGSLSLLQRNFLTQESNQGLHGFFTNWAMREALGMPDVELKSLASQGDNHAFVILPDCGSLGHGFCFIFSMTMSQFFLPISVISFYPLLWSLCLSTCYLPFRRNYFTCSCRLAVSVGEHEFRIFLAHHPEHTS